MKLYEWWDRINNGKGMYDSGVYLSNAYEKKEK